MRLVLLGAPGAGKGTQADILSRRLSIPVISTGNILREAMRNETELGQQAKNFVESGLLVPDSLIIGILKERIEKEDCIDGFILDGVPRTIAQADAITEMGIQIDKAISIEIDDDVIVRRMTGRRICSNCGMTFHTDHNPPKSEEKCDGCDSPLEIRNDDKPETVVERLRVYHELTEPLKSYYKRTGRLRSVEGSAPIEEITREILSVLEK